VGEWGKYGGIKINLKVKFQKKENFDSTCMITPGLVTKMRTSSSQMELVQSWGLGHSSHYNGFSIVSGIWKNEMHASSKCP
jgi:hypothetical protein